MLLKKIPLLIAVWVFALHFCGGRAFAAEFVPEQPTIAAENLRAGMKGYALTVMKGTEPVRLPLEIVSAIPQKGSPEHMIMIRLLPSAANSAGGLAQGMSGSPVYVDGKLAGAVSMGWAFSDHNVAVVTPIEDMRKIFSGGPGRASLQGMGQSPVSGRLSVSGLSRRAVSGLQSALGVTLESSPYGAGGELPLDTARFAPGDAAAVFLAWGDVEMSAVGTVTATSKDGRFLAFGHPFMERGAVSFPVARAVVHDVVSSQAFPFKIASPLAITGTATEDRANGVGGRMGYFTPSIAASLVFKDMDAGGRRVVKNFRVAPDAFLNGRLLSGIYSGLLDEQWNRRGEGTASVTLRVDGRGLTKGWTRSNVFFSDMDLSGAALSESAAIIDSIMLQPFREIDPIGFRLDVEVTREPRVLYIEDVAVSDDAKPGGKLDVEVTLRPWRRAPVKKRFELTVPEDAEGVCELVVRGGGTNPLAHLALEGGWKSVDSLERLLTELNAADANNEIILELLHDGLAQALTASAQSGGKPNAAGLIQEEKEFLSETKQRRIKEGTLRISRSEFFVDGVIRRMINLKAVSDDK